MPILARQITQAFLFAGAVLTAIMVSPYFTLDPEVYFPEQADTYQDHQIALLLHIGGGVIAILLGPFQFIKRLRAKHLTLHKIMGRVYALSCLIGGGAGLTMASRAHGGFPSTVGFGMLGILWITTIVFAIKRARERKIPAHREWMIRSFALTLAAFSLRMILLTHGILFETEVITLEFTPMYQATAWLCWVPNLLIAEWYINVSRTKKEATT